MTGPVSARVLGPNDGSAGQLGSIGVRFMPAGEDTGEGFALVEHPTVATRARGAAPLLAARTSTASSSRARSGALGRGRVRIGGRRPDLQAARPGTRSGTTASEPARILELISPAGFERYFEEVVEPFDSPGRPSRARSRRSPRGTASRSTATAFLGSRSSTTPLRAAIVDVANRFGGRPGAQVSSTDSMTTGSTGRSPASRSTSEILSATSCPR